QVKDPQQFVTQVVGTRGTYRTVEIEERLRSILLSKLQDVLGETTAASSVVELIGLTEEIGAAVRAKAQDDFEAIGMTLKTFYIGNLKPSTKSAQELRDMGMLDMATYTQLQAADAMRDAAQNPSGGAGLTAGIGAGMGIGNLMQQATSGAMQGQSGSGAKTAAAGIPDVMTPAEVASILKVSEEDVLAAINDKSLKAKKMGNAYRISKTALEEFLKS
ncbi:MAG: SPFH domain-containing protein, partial [Anaerolineales bacterium]